MKMAFVLFDKMTLLDLSGFCEAVTWLRMLNAIDDVSWEFVANREFVTDDRGLTMQVRRVLPDLSAYDLLFVPGGLSTRQLRHDPEFIDWIRTANPVPYKASVCTGALILGAAGFLQGKRATTNASAYELLEPYCAEVAKERVVRDGNVFTGGGVSASIDLGLYFVESLAGPDIAKQAQEKLHYPYYRSQEAGPDDGSS